MKRFPIYIFTIIISIATLCMSCIEDGFTTSSNDLLTFSTDTVAFDTIFTELSTPTASFTIYNRNKKMINISNIKVKGESSAKFYMNVDGVKGEEFNNMEIRGEDSIFVFIQAYIDPTNSNSPLEYKDKIEFTTNGVTQNVVITAWGQDVVRLRRPSISANTSFTAEKPYLIFDTLTVEKDATLTIDAGATLYLHDKAAIKVDGKLLALGTQESPIAIRGDRLDKVVGDISYDIMSGQWGGIRFTENSYGNEFKYINIRGSSDGVTIDSCNTETRKLHIFNSVLRNSSTSVLSSAFSWIEAEGSEFSDSKNSVVALRGGKVRMINCTFANYYLFSAISGSIVNVDYIHPEDATTAPAMDASFDNCILYGNTADINIGDLTGTNIYFRNCLLKSSGTDDNNFLMCKWKGDPKFFTERKKYIFDYRLKNGSDAIALGSIGYCPESARYDRYGKDRFSSSGIDIGAYVWVETKEEEKQ